MSYSRRLRWPHVVAVLLVASSTALVTDAHAGTKTATIAPASAWAGDAGVSVECRDSCGGAKTVIPGPIGATASFTVSCPDNGLVVSIKCTAFRGTDAAATIRSVEVSKAADSPFPLAPPENLSIR